MFNSLQAARASIEESSRDCVSMIMKNEFDEYLVALTVGEVEFAVENGFEFVELW